MKTNVQMVLTWAVVVSFVGLLAGCATTQTKQPTKAKQEQETIKEPTVGLVTETEVEEPGGKTEESVSWAGYTPAVMDKMQVVDVAFPTGNKKTSAILLHEVMPVEVLRGGGIHIRVSRYEPDQPDAPERDDHERGRAEPGGRELVAGGDEG